MIMLERSVTISETKFDFVVTLDRFVIIFERKIEK